jgi:hypothetical protein
MMGFATGHDFSRAEKRLISNGAFSPSKNFEVAEQL